MYAVLRRYAAPVAAVSVLAPVGQVFAQSADIATAATTALSTTQADVTSVAVVVAAIVALMAAASLIFAMIKK